MASTPPLQITSTPETPATPLHGATYDRQNNRSLRRATRSDTGIASRELRSTPRSQRRRYQTDLAITTPRPSQQPSSDITSGLHSPQLTPKHKAPRKVQIISPSSPDLHTTKCKPNVPSTTQTSSSSTTRASQPMLPTPVKTPQKKMAPKISGAARALFQENTHNTTASSAPEPSPRRSRRTKRYNGYSLESFSAADNGNQTEIQIFTDSRDKIPHIDDSSSNPFMARGLNADASSARKVAGTSKRRKVSGQKRMDPQVEEAIRKDEGMVYVFRGKKVYRRFDDGGDEEEEIDPDDLGLLAHSPTRSTVKPVKTLTRRSIKPTRLFQSEEQKRARELEKEEEALTDIEDEDGTHGDLTEDRVSKKEDEIPPVPKVTRSLRSSKRASSAASDEGHSREAGVRRANKANQASPFDFWPRVKHGLRATGPPSKPRKRGAKEAAGDELELRGTEPKKTKT